MQEEEAEEEEQQQQQSSKKNLCPSSCYMVRRSLLCLYLFLVSSSLSVCGPVCLCLFSFMYSRRHVWQFHCEIGLGANKAWREMMMMMMGDAAACGYWGFCRHWRWMQESRALPVHTTPHQHIRSCWLLHVCSSSVLLSCPSQMHFLFDRDDSSSSVEL